MTKGGKRLWWERDDLGYRDQRLVLAGADLAALARSMGTPLFVYSRQRLLANLQRLFAALAGRSFPSRIFFAIKANRFPPLLAALQLHGGCGADVCSPGELLLARQVGFAEEEISYTATAVADSDLDLIARQPGVWVNADSLSTIRRLGQRCPGRQIGLRLNPGRGLGYRDQELLQYAGSRPTKFGIYPARFREALDLAASFGLAVTGLHFHCGCGWSDPQLPVLDRILSDCRQLAGQVPGLRVLNVGGGLGVPYTGEDPPLDLRAWADLLGRHLGGLGCAVWVEPGNYLAMDAGVLLVQVNTVEEKEGRIFVGVNGGTDLVVEPAYYHLPLEVAVCQRRPDQPARQVTVAGHINEALDILAEDIELPAVEEGDFLALLNTGAYGSTMSSHHCLRGQFMEMLLP
ncbi:MAG: diaminopimelate decarboxylase [Thermodesulfobacteriota bacterium]